MKFAPKELLDALQEIADNWSMSLKAPEWAKCDNQLNDQLQNLLAEWSRPAVNLAEGSAEWNALAHEFLECVASGKIRFLPSNSG